MAIRSTVVFACLAAVTAVVPPSRVTAEAPPRQGPRTEQAQPQPAPAAQPDMMEMRRQMMAEMKDDEAKLNALVKEMTSAKGEAKVESMAAVISELVRQHTAMHGRMTEMHDQMMNGRGMMSGRGRMMMGQ